MADRSKCIGGRTAADIRMQNRVKRRKRIERYGSIENSQPMHQEIMKNLESIQGVLLRMNYLIQEEGRFGMYKRIVRKGT